MKKSFWMKALPARLAAAACTACLVFALSGLGVSAATTGVVSSSSGANVRSEADASSDLVASLEADAEVEVTDSVESGDYTWYYVTFTYEGSETSGYIRGDLLTVSESEDEDSEEDEEEDDSEEEDSTDGATINGYTVSEPEETYEDASSMDSSTVELDGVSYTAYMPTDGTEIYLVWATNEDGDSGWYWFDPDEETFQQDLGQFSSSGLISSLQNELTSLKETSSSKLATRMYIIIGLGVVAAVLLIIVTVLLIRNRDVEYIYEDDEDEVPEDWYKDEDEDDEEEEEEEEKPVRSRKDKKNKKDKKDRKKRSRKEESDDDGYGDGYGDADDLPEIDISGVFADDDKSKKNLSDDTSDSDDKDGGNDDFSDIEILDLDDFDF